MPRYQLSIGVADTMVTSAEQGIFFVIGTRCSDRYRGACTSAEALTSRERFVRVVARFSRALLGLQVTEARVILSRSAFCVSVCWSKQFIFGSEATGCAVTLGHKRSDGQIGMHVHVHVTL
jgi:hypothetical protein